MASLSWWRRLFGSQASPAPSPRLPFWRRWFGTRSENAADGYLRGLGYRMLAKNFTCDLGELDRVARDGDTIVFLEVRSTESKNLAGPAHSVDRAKQDRLTRLALYFLQKKRLLGSPARFDVLILSWPSGQSAPQIVHIKNAFEASGKFQLHS